MKGIAVRADGAQVEFFIYREGKGTGPLRRNFLLQIAVISRYALRAVLRT